MGHKDDLWESPNCTPASLIFCHSLGIRGPSTGPPCEGLTTKGNLVPVKAVTLLRVLPPHTFLLSQKKPNQRPFPHTCPYIPVSQCHIERDAYTPHSPRSKVSTEYLDVKPSTLAHQCLEFQLDVFACCEYSESLTRTIG